MLLKKSIASPENPSCDNGTGGSVLLCVPSPAGRPVGRDNLTGVTPQLEPTARLPGVGASLVCTMWDVVYRRAARMYRNENSDTEAQEVVIFGIPEHPLVASHACSNSP